MDKQWYVIHAYSGYEVKVREALLERIERLGMDDFLEKSWFLQKKL